MKTELLLALEQIVKEKGLSKDMLLDALKLGLASAYKKDYGSDKNVEVEIDGDTGEIKVFAKYFVVETPYDDSELTLEEAKEINPIYEIGDVVTVEVTPSDFGRLAAQNAKQVVVQKIKEAERQLIFDEYSAKSTEIVNGSIHRISKGIVHIDLGRTEALLLPNDQVKTEKYVQGERIKTVITEVTDGTKGPKITLSRAHKDLVKRLFELEVPEIYDGDVEVKSISREAGSRTKIAVHADNPDLDSIGSCVGPRGQRVQAIVDELQGEKIDIVEWDENPAIYISNALNPAKVVRVEIYEEEVEALVVVPDFQLSLAIGKEGQNARLAAKLTGWKIDIKSESQYKEYLKETGEYEEVYGNDSVEEDNNISEQFEEEIDIEVAEEAETL